MQYFFILTLLFAPSYAIRFGLLGVPANALMIWLSILWLVFAVWLVLTGRLQNFFAWFSSEVRRWYVWLAIIFFLSGLFSLFAFGVSEAKLGQFVVLFFQPLGTFVLFRYVLHARGVGREAGKLFVRVALLFLAVSGAYAVLQYFTLIGVPPEWWGNSLEPKRAVSFFLHPNFYSLFVTPLLAFLLPVVGEPWLGRRAGQRPNRKMLLATTAWAIGAFGLFLSLSRGGWAGLLAAMVMYVFASRSIRFVRVGLLVIMVTAVVVLAVPNFRYRVLLPFQGEKSAVARLSLWRTGWHMVEDNPVKGKGLLGFSRNWCMYNTDPGLSQYPAPHNIFLNFWVDTGVFGLLSFVGLLFVAIRTGVRRRATNYQLGLALACLAVVVHGMIDIPYLKNDLALLFWLLYAFL